MNDKLEIKGVDHQVEFQLATYQAIENGRIDFTFNGYLVRTAAAIDAVRDIVANRTYH